VGYAHELGSYSGQNPAIIFLAFVQKMEKYSPKNSLLFICPVYYMNVWSRLDSEIKKELEFD
jgi:hypothetical protein